jgi:hypothetical protein
MIVLDADDADQFALFIGFQAEDQAKLAVEANRAFAAQAPLTL